jgi:arylformamidase
MEIRRLSSTLNCCETKVRQVDHELEASYSPSSAIGGDYQPYIAEYIARSAASRNSFPDLLDQQIGHGDLAIDIFAPQTTNFPMVVFIHGGYWQELSRFESSFNASGLLAQGIGLAVLDYQLAPSATIPQMVGQCSVAMDYLSSQCEIVDFDPTRVILAGSSAGAHLAIMTALQRRTSVAGLVLVSGVYDLRPLVETSINNALGLTAESAWDISPLRYELSGLPPTIVTWGEIETEAFKMQARAVRDALALENVVATAFEVPQRNHFDIVFDLGDPVTKLGQAVSELCKRGGL